MVPRPETEAIAGLVREWLPGQRWFSAKDGGLPQVTVAGRLPLRADDLLIEVEIVTVHSDGRTATYQVPLTFRPEPLPALVDVLVGTLEVSGQRLYVYDAPHDPAFVMSWLTVVMTEDQVSSPGSEFPVRAVGHRQPGIAPTGCERRSRVLGVEQSNTSIIVADDRDPDPLIIKVFRVLQPGANPDVSVTSVLTEADCRHIPRLTGWMDGLWLDPHGDRVQGHLASVSEFFPDSRDAWQQACVAVEEGRSFRAEAERIGAATANVHAAMARSLPTAPVTGETVRDLTEQLDRRLQWAVEAVPTLDEFAPGARTMIESIRGLTDLPRRQRIHGDMHLGQVLDAGPRGWMLLDFEGEPLRPLDDRNRLDLLHRDLAGMLRSFDYAARHVDMDRGTGPLSAEASEEWVTEARSAFLSGYRSAGGLDPYQAPELLAVLELDKALYEVVYESRNRPSWIPIPMAAVRRLCAHVQAH